MGTGAKLYVGAKKDLDYPVKFHRTWNTGQAGTGVGEYGFPPSPFLLASATYVARRGSRRKQDEGGADEAEPAAGEGRGRYPRPPG